MEYCHYAKKAKALAVDPGKVLTFCKTTTMKNDVMRMVELHDEANVDILYDEDRRLKEIAGISKLVKGLKETLCQEIRDEEYYTRAEILADKIENKIREVKNNGAAAYAEMEEEAEELERELALIENNIEVYERKVEVDENEGQENQPKRVVHDGHGVGGDGNVEGIAKIEVIEDFAKQRTQLGHEYRNLIDRMQEMKFTIVELNSAIETNGGLNCGWASGKDHSEYCKLRLRHQGRTESIPFFDECKILLPLYPEDMIREHTAVYHRFLKLEARRKEILAEYKVAKQEKGRLETAYRAEINAKIENQKKEDPEKLKVEQARKKELIERWKKERVVQKVITDDKLVVEKAKFEADKEEKRRKELEEKKKLVQEYREKKEIEKVKEFERNIAADNQRRYVSSEQRVRIKQKEEELIEKKRQVVLQKKSEEEEKKIKKELELLQKHKK